MAESITLYYLLQQLINGLSLGAIYGLIAIGYTMVYGIIGMINFAHGEVYMIGAFIGFLAFFAMQAMGVGYAPFAIVMVLCISMFFTAFYGWTIERLAYRRLRHSQRLAPLISAIGMSIFLQNYVQILQGARTKALPPVIEGTIAIIQHPEFSVNISVVQLLIIGVTIFLMGVFTYVIQRTSLGRAQRACEQDKTMASLVGINVDRTVAITFIIGAMLASVAGVMVTMYYGVVDFYMGFLAGIKAFTAAVLGGIGSVAGAMLGGLLIGLIEALWSAYFGPEYKNVVAFGILILVLIVRPSGLLGKPDIKKV